VKAHLQKAETEINKAASLLNELADLPLPSPFDEAVFRAAHAASASGANREHGFTITPTTPLLIEDFVRMAARHTPPFKGEDQGFRDAVHLQSVISHMQSVPPAGEAVFVTKDLFLSTACTTAGLDVVPDLTAAIQALSKSLGVNFRAAVDWIPELKSAVAEWVPTLSNALLHLGGLFDWLRLDLRAEPKLNDFIGAPLAYSPEEATPNLYRVTFDMSLRVVGMVRRAIYYDRDRPGGPFSDYLDTRIEENSLIAVEALVTQTDAGQIQSIKYESARLRGRMSSRINPLTQQLEEYTEELPAPVPLIIPDLAP
jgi:hypothetical protein